MKKDKSNFTTKLHKLAGKDNLRPDLMNIYFKDDYVYVTNAHIGLKQHISHHGILKPENLNGKALHAEVFAFIKNRFIQVIAEEDHIVCYDKFNNKVTFDYITPEKENYWPEAIESVIPNGPYQDISEIGFRHNVLNTLCEGLITKENQLRFQFTAKNRAIVVTTPEISNQIGILMPVMIFDNER